jgi:hypothetical protein
MLAHPVGADRDQSPHGQGMTNKNVSLMEFQTSNAKISCLLHVRRVKQGTPSTHPIVGDELRALRRLQREQEPKSPFVFTSERGTPLTTAGFARMIERAGIEAKFGFKPQRLYELGFPEFLVNGKRLKLRRENQRCDHHPAKKRGTY